MTICYMQAVDTEPFVFVNTLNQLLVNTDLLCLLCDIIDCLKKKKPIPPISVSC